MWHIFRALSAAWSTFLVVFTIPLAFDVGGRECGLAFSASLAAFYFVHSLLRLMTPPESRFRAAGVQLIRASDWVIVAALLIWSLNKFSVELGPSGWAERVFKHADRSIYEQVFGRGGLLESFAIGSWDKLLRWSTPFFQVGEGFCSLLVIQAFGQIARWLVNGEYGDSWAIGFIGLSAGVSGCSMWFLWRITTFPDIGNVDAILIGSAITCALFLASWGIISGRGNVVESSLLFAYVTLCTYQIFTDYQPSAVTEETFQAALPPLPPIIMASYSTLLHALSTLPSTIRTSFSFLAAAVMTATPSVLISLAYRTSVMVAAARIIPAVRESGAARALADPPSLEDSDGASRFVALLSLFSPSILVAVYTSLLMQHFAAASGNGHAELAWWAIQGGTTGGNMWRWINLSFTMVVYSVELYMGREDAEYGLTHWKTD